MLPKLSRYFLIVITVTVLAYALPAIYNTVFETRVNIPYITYSTLHKDYLTMRPVDGQPAFVNRKGEVFTQQEFMNMTPITNYTYQLSKGTLPDSLFGVRLDPRVLQRENIWQLIDPRNLYAPAYQLYPLFESEPEYGLKLPADVFRINRRIEFINAKTNTVNEEKSDRFTASFKEAGFQFPARLVSGIGSAMKRRDDGWFLVDDQHALYHLKQVKGNPYFRKISTPDSMIIQHIICNDFESQEFYALLITGDNQLFTLNTRDYSLTRIPVEDYDPKSQLAMLSGNLFNKSISFIGDESVRVLTFDRSYHKIDGFEEKLPVKAETIHGRVAAYIFPFQVKAVSSKTQFVRLTPQTAEGYNWLVLNILFLGAGVYILKREGRTLSKNRLDLLIVALTGIFGFLAIHIFPNREY